MSGKLPGVPVREFRKTLEDNGFKYDRSNSGHEIWERKQSVSIPIHSKEINGGIARRLSKQYHLKDKQEESENEIRSNHGEEWICID